MPKPIVASNRWHPFQISRTATKLGYIRNGRTIRRTRLGINSKSSPTMTNSGKSVVSLRSDVALDLNKSYGLLWRYLLLHYFQSISLDRDGYCGGCMSCYYFYWEACNVFWHIVTFSLQFTSIAMKLKASNQLKSPKARYDRPKDSFLKVVVMEKMLALGRINRGRCSLERWIGQALSEYECQIKWHTERQVTKSDRKTCLLSTCDIS